MHWRFHIHKNNLRTLLLTRNGTRFRLFLRVKESNRAVSGALRRWSGSRSTWKPTGNTALLVKPRPASIEVARNTGTGSALFATRLPMPPQVPQDARDGYNGMGCVAADPYSS